MKFFLVWECFNEDFSLLEKGYHFLVVDDPDNIDIEVGNYAEEMARVRDMNPFFFVITTCQPMPSAS